MVDLLIPLHRHFGYRAFRAGQEALVRTVLDGRDLLAVMPTGSGKSMGFQLPALLLPGTTLVVSPLIALMKDQVDELNRRGIAAAAVHSQVPVAARREALAAVRDGTLRLLYVAPERFASETFARAIGEVPVARFVVDEAHCVSEWGHDFRPDYRRLRDAASVCRRSDGGPGRVPIAAFTATATPEVRDDIVELLGLDEPQVVVAGFDRPNIHPRVQRVGGEREKQQILPGLIGRRRVLVYRSTREGADVAAAALRSAGVEAEAYHGGMGERERTRVQEAFASGAARVVCATNAFGMGIDRPDIDAVVHADIPGSVEAYYQEIGRAGRDGRPAEAVLLWNYADVKTREFLIDHAREGDRGRGPQAPGRDGPDPREVERRKALEHRKLRRMVAYASTAACQRATILRYFGDPAVREPCGACGNCDGRRPIDEAGRLFLRKIFSGIARARLPYGRRKIAAMLVGHTEGLPEALTGLSTTGLLGGHDPRDVERWIDAACAAGLIAASADKYRTLTLTAEGHEVMAGRLEEVCLNVPEPPPRGAGRGRARRGGGALPMARDQAAEPDPATFEALRAWRRGEARRRGIAPFLILHDRVLAAIAAARPGSARELEAVPGIGPAKLDAYGEAVLAVVRSGYDGGG